MIKHKIQTNEVFRDTDVHYTTKPISKVLDEISELYDYLLVSSSEDIVKDYYLARKDFFEKSNSHSYCEIADIATLISIPKTIFWLKKLENYLRYSRHFGVPYPRAKRESS